MKKTLFKVIVYIFCVFSIVELYAEEGVDNLEKKNFFKIERLEAEIIFLKDQYQLLTEQQRLDFEKKSEPEDVLNLETEFIELKSKVNTLNKEILFLKNQYKSVSEKQVIKTE